jgi:hypothetical protein
VRRVPFSCFARPDSFSTVPRASGPVFKFFAPGLIFGCSEGVGSRFHVLRTRNRFHRCRVRQVPFSCFALPDSFSAVLRASGSFFIFCPPGLVFCGTEGVQSRFQVLRGRTHFRRFGEHRVPFSSFALPNSFSSVQWASGPVFMFYAPGLVFYGTDGVGSRFLIFRARTHFRVHRGRRVSFSCFALQDSFSPVPRASGPHFHVLRVRTRFRRYRGRQVPFHVLHARAGFRRYRGRRVPFSSFELPESFSAIPRASGPIFMFCAPVLIFGATEGVVSRFHVFHARTLFRRY